MAASVVAAQEMGIPHRTIVSNHRLVLYLVHRPVLILGLAVLALATVVSRKPWLTPKRLIYRTHVLRLDDALVRETPRKL
ncbi:hypothetical protein Pla52n_63840 [Stieleria varia]|uniref:Uncharacterized protein n=1 Tax=Stieleria varia TaxID=2528005 RepID=A0A5C5ZYM6_9BACT|nr:hypothetical protein Pla52n_63840 [Stieleria varia]